MLRILFFILITLILCNCSSFIKNENVPYRENDFAFLYGVEEEDMILYKSKHGNFEKKVTIIGRVYPNLFKEKICYVDQRRDTTYLFLIEPKLDKKDSIKLPMNVLNTSWYYDFGNYLVIKDHNKFILYNSKLGRIEAIEKTIELIYIAGDSLVYFVEQNDHNYKQEPTSELKILDLKTRTVNHITNIQESCLIDGGELSGKWYGMIINENVLFIKTMYSIIALDKSSGRILDKIAEDKNTILQSLDKNKVVFYSDKKITFSMKKQKFI